jgi:chlorobactene glucosyltransferase
VSQSIPASGPLLSVIIPARNESLTIADVLQSVLATTYQPIEILVVDDRSTDDTVAQVERGAAKDSRVQLIRGAELPAGWYGKPWACLQGYREARGNYLLFLDADTRHDPRFFAHAVGMLQTERAGLLTVLPFQECVTFWERVVMPQVWHLLGMRFHPNRVNRAARARDIIANGQFILVTREAYERAGTHEAVRGEVAEDLALAQKFFRDGQTVRLAHADDMMTTRMYRSLPQLIEGWSKNAYIGGRQSFPDEPLLRALVPLLLVLAPLFWLLPLIGLGIALIVGHAALLGAALAAIGCSALFWSIISRIMRIPLWHGLAYPLGAAVVLHIFLRSLWRGERRIEWRGRTYGIAGRT